MAKFPQRFRHLRIWKTVPLESWMVWAAAGWTFVTATCSGVTRVIRGRQGVENSTSGFAKLVETFLVMSFKDTQIVLQPDYSRVNQHLLLPTFHHVSYTISTYFIINNISIYFIMWKHPRSNVQFRPWKANHNYDASCRTHCSSLLHNLCCTNSKKCWRRWLHSKLLDSEKPFPRHIHPDVFLNFGWTRKWKLFQNAKSVGLEQFISLSWQPAETRETRTVPGNDQNSAVDAFMLHLASYPYSQSASSDFWKILLPCLSRRTNCQESIKCRLQPPASQKATLARANTWHEKSWNVMKLSWICLQNKQCGSSTNSADK